MGGGSDDVGIVRAESGPVDDVPSERMLEPGDDGRLREHLGWVLADHAGAYRWMRDLETREFLVGGLVLYGKVDNARLKALRMPTMGPIRYNFGVRDEWSTPPTQAQVAHMASQAADIANGPARVSCHTQDDGTRLITVVTAGRHPLGVWSSKQPGQSADEFFAVTAQLFTLLTELHPKGTTKALAEYADVPFTTAVRWVRECRDRGLLPKSSKQLNRAKGDPS